MLIGTWLPSFFVHSNTCFASLVWYVQRYGILGLKLLAITGVLMTLAAVIIFVRLSTVSLIDEHQRIAASRMVYYLVLGIVSLVSCSHSSDRQELILSGFRYSILWILGRSTRRYQARNDGDRSVELVRLDEWTITAFPEIKHCRDIFRCQAGTPMGSKEAPDSDVWAERVGNAQSLGGSRYWA
jgi:hypothetical protein